MNRKLILALLIPAGVLLGCRSPQVGPAQDKDGIFSPSRQDVMESMDARSYLLVVSYGGTSPDYQRTLVADPEGVRAVGEWIEKNLPRRLPRQNEIGAVMARYWIIVAQRNMTEAIVTGHISLYRFLSRTGKDPFLDESQFTSFTELLKKWGKPYQVPIMDPENLLNQRQ